MLDSSQSATTQPTVLLLGIAHLANNNRDMLNPQFDDMHSPRRQREIEACVEQLKRFQPTKVAVEILIERQDSLNKDYFGYRAGTFALSTNEIHQLGFRIAAQLEHDRVFAIDWNGDIGFDYAFDFAKEHGQWSLIKQAMASIEQEMMEFNTRIEQRSVGEMLRYLNEPASLLRNHQFYMGLMRIGEEKVYAGVDVVKNWYARNMRIFVNLTRIPIESEDRILVLYGAGHIPLLKQYVQDSGLDALEKTLDYL